MKKTLIIILALATGLIMVGQAAAQGISGSAHDFSTETWNTSGEICITCHTPHNAMAGKPVLWNHTLTDNSTYVNNLQTAFGTTWGTPDGPSLLCLSCHDGTVALDNFGGTTSGTNFIGAGEQVGDGTTLDGNHPISVDYNAALVTSGELNDITSAETAGVNIYGSAPGRIQCGSCHDVHNSAGITKLLRTSNAASALCMACHNK